MDQGRGPGIALVYDGDAYEESASIPDRPIESGGTGLMGRRVAGRSFLDAYLSYGDWSGLMAIVRDRQAAEPLTRLWRSHPATHDRSRTLSILERSAFLQVFFPKAPATLLHYPQPPDSEYAWARQARAPHAFAISGVTHSLCSSPAVELLRNLVTAPFEPYDALICTSRAVKSMVLEITGTYADYLRNRLGVSTKKQQSQSFPLRMETIPLGVDLDRFRPASHEERLAARQSIGVADDEVAALYVGRLSHHAKAHPFPMFRSVSEAAHTTGRTVHLILAGWAAHPAIHAAYVDAAARFAPGVRTTILDGRDPTTRRSVWHAADLFISPSDSIQETFGLAVLEAMASGLPVVASDWDGYRDIVRHGETGFLVGTAMVEGATVSATTRLLIGELTYDHFLAECSQATAIDVTDMKSAIVRLVSDEPLRHAMGQAGRRRALEYFSWPRIIRQYEALWDTQETERLAWNQKENEECKSQAECWGAAGAAAYPSPERTFSSYPTIRLDRHDHLVATPDASDALELLLAHTLTHHTPGRRVSSPEILRAALAEVPCSIGELDRFWSSSGIEHSIGRASLAWMLKYNLIRGVRNDHPEGGRTR